LYFFNKIKENFDIFKTKLAKNSTLKRQNYANSNKFKQQNLAKQNCVIPKNKNRIIFNKLKAKLNHFQKQIKKFQGKTIDCLDV
jgi:hypothetical protein